MPATKSNPTAVGRALLIALAIFLSFSVSAFAWWGDADEKAEEIYDETVSLAGGGKVEVESHNGSIKVSTWDRDEVKVHAKKKANGKSTAAAEEMLREIEVRVETFGDTVRISAEMPKWERGGSGSVQFELTIPRGAHLAADTHNGSIEVRDLGGDTRLETHNGSVKAYGVSGDLKIDTSNGSITAENVRGVVEAHTRNGSITAEMGAERLTKDVSFETTNGSINLTLNPSLAASIDARTSNGSVKSDFAGGVQDKRKKTLELDLNGGGSRIEVRSRNGSIRIRER